jgi:hypothetical protein
MITPDQLQALISYRAPEITRLAKEGGWKGPAFSSCKFLGITNGGQICYMAVYLCEGGTDSTKVFLTHTAGKVKADIQLTELY